MKLKKQFNHLRIGKGLLCLLALFMMLLAPQGAWAAASVYTTSTLTVVQNEDFNCTWTIDEWHAFNVYSNSTTSDPSVSVSDQSLVVTATGCTIRGLKGSSAPSDFWNIVYKVEILGDFSDNSKISVKLDMDYGDDHNFIASTVPGEFYLPNSVEWNWQDELCIEIGKACTITGIRVYYSTASNTASYGWADEPKDNNNQDISGAKQTDGSIKINYNEHHSYKYPFAVSGANYNSTDETVATIDTDGTVTIKKTGSTTITATIHNQNDYANDDLIFGYTLTVTEEEVSYGLSVAGVDVTSGNANNVLGDELENHMVTFDAANNTLTLNNATINPTGERYGVYYTGTSDFTIKLIGTNSITTGNGCEPIIFNAYQPTTIPTLTFESGSSPCSLALNGGNNTVIKYFGSVQGINGLGTTTTGNLCLIADEQAQYIANTGLYKGETTSSGAVTSATITSGYGLKVAGVWVHDGNKDNVLGDQEETHKVTFTPAVAAEGDNPATPATLTLNNANFNGTINWTDPSDLKVEILGSNTIDVSYSSFFTGNENANLILATNASNPGQLKLTTCSHGNEVSGWKNNDIIYNTEKTDTIAADFDWWADFSVSDQSLLMFNKKYDLWVDNVRLCSAQSEIVYGQTNVSNVISFDGNHTLTFNNVTANSSNNPFIKNGLSSLEINLVGENMVNCGQLFLTNNGGETNNSVTFSTSGTTPGNLNIYPSNNASGAWYTGHSTPTCNNGLIVMDETTSDGRAIMITTPPAYGLEVAGVNVTYANADNVLGDELENHMVTFNAENNTLTLNGATINGRIFSELEDGLTVHLLGTNVIDGGYDNDHAGEIAFVTEGEEVPLTFTTDAENPGQLLMKNTYRDGGYAQYWNRFTTSFTNGLTYTSESNKGLIAIAPVMTPGEGLYWTDQTYTISGLEGATIKYKDNLDKISETEYNGAFTIGTAGKYSLGVWQTLTVDDTNFSLYGNNDIYIVHNKPGFSVEAGTHTGTQNITLTNLPANLSANTTSYPQVWYYLGDNEQDSIQYTSAEQEIAVTESTKVSVYIIDEDSGKVIKSKSVEAEYTILKNPDLHFWTSENSLQTGDNYGTVDYNNLESFTSPTLKGKIGNSYTNELTDLGITYSSSDNSVATVDATGKVTIVGGGYVTIKAVSQETEVYAADSTWFEIAIRPKDPQISLAKGVYYTGKKIALTPTMPNGKMYYSIGYDGTLTEYTDSITLPVGANDIYAYTSCGTGDKIMRSYGNGHTMFFVYDKPVFSIESGTYDSSQEVTITTNIPENDNYASVYYKLNNSTTDSTLYKNGDKITISETTRVCAYYCVQESDKYVSDPVEAYYVIRQDAGLAFVQGEEPVEVAEYIIGGNENLPLPTLQNENNLTVTYSSEDENVATVNASGVVTIVGMGETLIKATSEETAEFIEGYASYPLRVYKDLSHDDITVEVADAIYTSKAVTPEVTVKDGNTDITELLNIVYSNNVNAGSNAIVTITPNSELDDPNYYCGSTTANFSIDYRTLADGEVTFHNNWATFYNAVGDVNLPTNTKIGAYIVTEVNNDRVIVTQIKNVPQGVAVLLNNNTTTTTENTSTTGNKLMHASQEVNTSTGSAIYYGLYNGAMKRIYGTIPEGKNYLMLSIAPQNAPQLNIVIGNDGNTTGISQTESRESEVENVYDLQGRKIQKPSKNGMYIKNGRKVLINNNNRY